MPVAAAALAVLAARGHRRSVIRLALATGTSWRQAQGPRKSSRLSGQPGLGWHRPETGREALAQLIGDYSFARPSLSQPWPVRRAQSSTGCSPLARAGQAQYGPRIAAIIIYPLRRAVPFQAAHRAGAGRTVGARLSAAVYIYDSRPVRRLSPWMTPSAFPASHPGKGASSMYKLLPATGGALHHVFCCMLDDLAAACKRVV